MPLIKSRNAIPFIIIVLAASHYCAVRAEVSVKWAGKDEVKNIASTSFEGVPWVSIKDACDAIGFTCRWNKTNRKLTCAGDGRKVVFSEDIPFYYINDTLRQLPCAPAREGTVLYLPAWLTALVLNGAGRDRIEWNDAESAMIINPLKSIADNREKTDDNREKTMKGPSGEAATAPVVGRQSIKTIVIDPGHGGKDPGAIGPDGAKEKDIVLSIALKLHDLLKKKSDFRFI